MKKLILFLFLLPFLGFGQSIDEYYVNAIIFILTSIFRIWTKYR